MANMEALLPALYSLIGAIATALIFLLFPDIRRMKVAQGQAEASKGFAEADNVQLTGVGDTMVKFAEAFHLTTVSQQDLGREFAKTIADSSQAHIAMIAEMNQTNIAMFRLVRDTQSEAASERKLMLDRINELGQQVKQLQLEKDNLEETLEAASIEINDINSKRAKERDDCAEKLTKVKGERDKLIKEREALVSQFIDKAIPAYEEPPELTADTLQTKILSQEEKTPDENSTIGVSLNINVDGG